MVLVDVIPNGKEKLDGRFLLLCITNRNFYISMKKTLSLLAAAALVLSAAPGMAETIELLPNFSFQSVIKGATIAPGATLINTTTGGMVIYDINTTDLKIEPPFNTSDGTVYWGVEIYDPKKSAVVSLKDVAVSEGDEIVLNFTTWYSGGGAGMGGPVDKEYFVIMFRSMTGEGDNFSTWYDEGGKDIPITARFLNGTYEAYIIDETCDQADPASTWGGLVFFRANDVAPKVRDAEVFPVPEPTTTTLSLLAFAGLVMRRRRR
ncbi:MAG: PEP-CTERM sorting domain-containing protein [Akkermansia sp.]|nr:PEP-CTERM sorting domain-containing protein [Akkermansia sp.]